MTITIPAEANEIAIFDGRWQIIPLNDRLTVHPDFEVLRGAGVMNYTAEFGKAHNLPGTVLSVELVQAVIIGYEKASRRWLLGFHIARRVEDKPRWLEILRWPPGDNLQYGALAQQAGRTLAEHVGCPLKIFGAQKLPHTQPLSARSGITGPLEPHQRTDIPHSEVQHLTRSIALPLEYPGMWLGQSRGGITLRLDKSALDRKADETPAYTQCIINADDGKIRLQPPTGLLGSFFGGGSRDIRANDVRNVERRETLTRQFEPREGKDGLVTEITYTTHNWGIYLTLKTESILLAQTSHTTSSELSQQRAMAGNKFAVDTKAGVEYLRQHQEDQQAHDRARNWAEAAALVIANTLKTHLVKTTVEY